MPVNDMTATDTGQISKRFGLPEGAMLASVPLLLLASFSPQNGLRLGFVIAGGALMLVGLIMLIMNRRQATVQRRAVKAALALVRVDPDPVLIATRDGQLVDQNDAARKQFGAPLSSDVADVLAKLLADPEPAKRRVHEQLEQNVAVKEDVRTFGGRFRLSVTPHGHDLCIWRFDDLSTDEGEEIAHLDQNLPRVTIDRDNRIIESNHAAQKLLGGQPATLRDLTEDGAITFGQINNLRVAGGSVRSLVFQTDGGQGQHHLYLLPESASGGPPKVNTGWDAIEDLPVPLMKIGRDGALLASNREARQLLKIDDTDGKQVGDLLDGLGRPINDWLREAADGRGHHISQFLRGRGTNQDTFVQVTLNISGDPAEAHLIAVLNDVTELKTLEAQFVQSQKMQAIGQLAGGVAHDFNNLLTAISGHCDLLLLRHDEGDQNYSDLIQIHQNANRAASLVGQLLAFSRKQNLQPEIIDLRDTLSDLTHLLNRLVGEKVTLSLHHDPALAQIKADKRQLEQVLMNLVVNARDAMPGGGEIKVVTENLLLKEQMIKDRAVVPPGEYVMVKVTDAGHGIAPEKLPKIFEPFYTTKRTGEGTGLGLSTAYGIVKQTGGFIFAESEPEQGTQFSLLFPSYDLPVAEPLAIPAPGPAPISSSADGVVLLVEDEAPVRAFASRALRLRGYTVLEADCAESALDLLSDPELAVDIFVTDVIMPGMDGPTWVRSALEDRPNTKVVFVSGYAEDAFGDEKSRIPNSVFLPKPFSLNALTQTVQAQLQDTRLSA